MTDRERALRLLDQAIQSGDDETARELREVIRQMDGPQIPTGYNDTQADRDAIRLRQQREEQERQERSQEFALGRSRGAVGGYNDRLLGAFGLNDQAAGLSASVQNRFFGGDLDPDTVAQVTRDETRRQIEEQPLRRGLEEGVATLPLAVLGPQRLATTTLGRIGQAGAWGAPFGALAGYGNADEGPRWQGALAGGAAGAITGTGLGGVFEGAGAVVPHLGRGARRVGQAFGLFGGSAAARKEASRRAANTVQQRAQQEVMAAARAGNVTPDQVRARFEQSRQTGVDDPFLFELLGPEGLDRLRTAGVNSPRARQMIEQALARANQKQQQVIQRQAERGLGRSAADFGDEMTMTAAQMAEAGKAYAPFYDLPGLEPQQIETFVGRPTFRRALRDAVDSAADRNEDISRYIRVDNDGNITFAGGDEGFIPTRVLDYVKQELDTMVNDARTAFQRGTGRRRDYANAVNVRNEYRDFLDSIYSAENIPEAQRYSTVRGRYAGPARRQEILQRGRDAMREDADETLDFVADLNPDEMSAFRAGVARGIADELERVRDGVVGNANDAAARIAGQPRQRRAIEAAFGVEGREAAEQFVLDLASSSSRFRELSRARPSAHSDTAYLQRGADNRDNYADLVGGMALDAQTGSPGLATAAAAGRRGVNAVGRFISQRVNNRQPNVEMETEVARLLLSNPDKYLVNVDPLTRAALEREAQFVVSSSLLMSRPAATAAGGEAGSRVAGQR